MRVSEADLAKLEEDHGPAFLAHLPINKAGKSEADHDGRISDGHVSAPGTTYPNTLQAESPKGVRPSELNRIATQAAGEVAVARSRQRHNPAFMDVDRDAVLPPDLRQSYERSHAPAVDFRDEYITRHTQHFAALCGDAYDRSLPPSSAPGQEAAPVRDDAGPASPDATSVIDSNDTNSYGGDIMPTDADFELFSRKTGVPVPELQEFVSAWHKRAATEVTQPKPPRLKWNQDNEPDETPAAFAWRAYAAEAEAGTLHRGVIAREDKALAVKLASWLRSYDMPEGIDIPTQPKWNSRQLEKAGKPPKPGVQYAPSEEARLHAAARYRATHPDSPRV